MKAYLAVLAGALVLAGSLDRGAVWRDAGMAMLRGEALEGPVRESQVVHSQLVRATGRKDAPTGGHRAISIRGSEQHSLSPVQAPRGLSPEQAPRVPSPQDKHPVLRAFEDLAVDLIARVEALAQQAPDAEERVSLWALLDAHPELAREIFDPEAASPRPDADVAGALLGAANIAEQLLARVDSVLARVAAHPQHAVDAARARLRELVTELVALLKSGGPAGEAEGAADRYLLALDTASSLTDFALTPLETGEALAGSDAAAQSVVPNPNPVSVAAEHSTTSPIGQEATPTTEGAGEVDVSDVTVEGVHGTDEREGGGEQLKGGIEGGAGTRYSPTSRVHAEPSNRGAMEAGLIEVGSQASVQFIFGLTSAIGRGISAVATVISQSIIQLLQNVAVVNVAPGYAIPVNAGHVNPIPAPPSARQLCVSQVADGAWPRVLGLGGRFNFPAAAIDVTAGDVLPPDARDVSDEHSGSLTPHCIMAGAFAAHYPVAVGQAPLNATNLAEWARVIQAMDEGSNGADVAGGTVLGGVRQFSALAAHNCVQNVSALLVELDGWCNVTSVPLPGAARYGSSNPVRYWPSLSVVNKFNELLGLVGPNPTGALKCPALGFAWPTALQLCANVLQADTRLASLKFVVSEAASSLRLVETVVRVGGGAVASQIAAAYDIVAGNPRWVAKRLSKRVTGVVGQPPVRADNAFLLRLATQSSTTADMWHREELQGGELTAPDDWLQPTAVGASQYNARTRGHMIAASYAGGTSVGIMSTMSTGNAASQPKHSNNNVWSALEGRVTTLVSGINDNVFIVVGVDGVHSGPSSRLDKDWLSVPPHLPLNASVDPAVFWTALYRPRVIPAGGVANYDNTTTCGAMAFACYNKQDYGALTVPPVNAAAVRRQCAHTNIANLTAWVDVDPFPSLTSSDRDCDGVRLNNAITMFQLGAFFP